MAKELVMVASGIKSLNEVVGDGGGDTKAGNSIKAAHNGVSPPPLTQQQAL